MEIVIIVNFIFAFSFVLGGACMMKYAPSSADHSIGYRTDRAVSSDEAWSFANRCCGRIWLISGTVFLVLTAAALLLISGTAGGIVQTALLVLENAAGIFSVIYTEHQLKKRYSNNQGGSHHDLTE